MAAHYTLFKGRLFRAAFPFLGGKDFPWAYYLASFYALETSNKLGSLVSRVLVHPENLAFLGSEGSYGIPWNSVTAVKLGIDGNGYFISESQCGVGFRLFLGCRANQNRLLVSGG
jgi:hypothetical protein